MKIVSKAFIATVVAAGFMLAPTAAHAAPIASGGASTQAASPKISCKQTNSSVRTCNIAVQGSYCGSSRRTGVGITTKLKGGIWSQITGDRLRWNASSTPKDHNLPIGGTFSAVVTLEGKSSDAPYVTCSL